MTLLTAHKILITTAVVFFFGFAVWEFARIPTDGGSWGLVRVLLYFTVSVGFGVYLVYLRSLKKWLK